MRQDNGWTSLLWNAVDQYVYSMDICEWHGETVPAKISVEVRKAKFPADMDTLSTGLLAELGLAGRWVFHRFRKHRRARLYIAEHGSDILHTTWIHFGPVRVGKIDIPAGAVSIGPCFTQASARGQAIYPHVLSTILNELKADEIEEAIMAVGANNSSSIRGIERAGFICRGKLHYLRICRFWKCRIRSEFTLEHF